MMRRTFSNRCDRVCTSRFSVPLDPVSSPYCGVQVARLLLADAQLTDHVTVAVRIVRLEIVQQTTALTHQHQQATPGGVIFLVKLEVLSQLANTFTENRNLHFRATRISVMGAKARNNFGFLCSCQHGSALLLYVKSSPLSKCLTKNNMPSIVASTQWNRQGSRFGPQNKGELPVMLLNPGRLRGDAVHGLDAAPRKAFIPSSPLRHRLADCDQGERPAAPSGSQQSKAHNKRPHKPGLGSALEAGRTPAPGPGVARWPSLPWCQRCAAMHQFSADSYHPPARCSWIARSDATAPAPSPGRW